MPKVFISYASEDSETAEYLYLELTKRGVELWKDNKSLRSGDHFTSEIDKAIEASDLAIVCLSSVSVNKTGFVQKEFRKIIEMQGYRPEGIPFALPVKLDNCQPPQGFAEIHWRQMPTTNREAFIDTFVADIDEQLMKVARRKASFDRKATLSKLSSFFEMQNDVLCRLADYPEPIVIKASLQMMLVEAESYREAGSPDLSFWSREALDVILRRILFSRRYADLLLGFGELEIDIKRNLADEAEKIGYSVQQLIVAPDMAAMRWLEPFEIKVEDQFETRTPKFSVNIRIHVTTSVRRLSHIEQFLINRQDVPALMERAIIETARETLLWADAERVYLRFEFSDRPDEQPLRDVLADNIHKCLSEFDAKIFSIQIQLLPSELTARFDELSARSCPFEITITPLLGHEPIKLKGNFTVEGIHADGFHQFASRHFNLQQIANHIQEYVGARLATLSSEELKYQDLSGLNQIEQIVSVLAKECTRQVFGLSIQVNVVYRES